LEAYGNKRCVCDGASYESPSIPKNIIRYKTFLPPVAFDGILDQIVKPARQILLRAATKRPSFEHAMRASGMSHQLTEGRMRYLSPALFMMTALMLPAPATHAATMTFVASLSGANEMPPNASLGTGLATIQLDPTAETLQINATFSGLTSPDTAAHIHCCAPIGMNAGVATRVPAFLGFPLGGTSGTYSSPIFDLTLLSFYNQAFVDLQVGPDPATKLAQAEAALIAGILGGQTYFNIHTGTFPGGEIRGQLAPVPLPGSLVLFGSVLLGFRLFRQKLGF
jgi:CHRD domain